MIRRRSREAVWKILEAASFDVEEGDGQIDLQAYRDDECVIVLCSDEEDEIAAFDGTRYHYRVGDERKDCKKLLVTFNTRAATSGVIRWGEDEIAEFAGMATIAEILGVELALDIAAPVPASRVVEAEPEPVPEVSGPDLPHLPIKISRERAELISGQHGKATCRFIPHWHYRCSSEGEKVFRDRTISFAAEEAGAISAINGLPSEVPFDTVVVVGIPAGSEVLTPTIQRKEAEERIIEAFAESLTKNVRIKQVSGDTIFYEDKVIRPDRGNISIDLQLIYVPVWQIRGKKIVEINAHTGDILCEPMDEGVEII
ncbi:MAG: hypothetical protein GKC04_09115 [Methanomicrobiales archaeon]|nr:hypothetical protein [Methanomicrobiales archaeon]